jgi:uncharacterized protein YndB with AHSA1/START domain
MRYKKPSVPVSTIVNAPPEIIWKFLTEREFLSQWWWTPPIKGQITSLNVYPTGSILCQLTHKNRTYNSNYVYIQVSPNRRLVLTNALSNDLRPIISSLAETIIIDILPREDGTTTVTFERKVNSLETLSYLFRMNHYQGWVNNLEYLKILINQYYLELLQTPPDQL